ncbi:MAG: amino acid ABC transporter substrate-binding protein [bacterium]|nr:amino acid ABC transporter substrate-binding protein [bacterium]
MKKIIIIIIFSIPIYLSAQTIDEIKWISEEYPPFNYTDKNGEPAGIAVDILYEIWKKAGIEKKKIEFLPWARSYIYIQKDKNICLFAMSITGKRKKIFTYVGPMFGSKLSIIAKKSKKLKIKSVKDLENLKLAAIRKDIGYNMIMKYCPDAKYVRQVSKSILLIRMLQFDRVEAISLGDIPFFWLIKKEGLNPNDYELVYIFKRNRSGFAFNKNVNKKIVRRLQKAFNAVKKDGTVKKIRYKYTH